VHPRGDGTGALRVADTRELQLSVTQQAVMRALLGPTHDG